MGEDQAKPPGFCNRHPYRQRRGSAAAVCGNRWYPPSNREAVLTARGGGAVPQLVRYFGPSWTRVGVRGQATPAVSGGSQRLTRLLNRGRHRATACSQNKDASVCAVSHVPPRRYGWARVCGWSCTGPGWWGTPSFWGAMVPLGHGGPPGTGAPSSGKAVHRDGGRGAPPPWGLSLFVSIMTT